MADNGKSEHQMNGKREARPGEAGTEATTIFDAHRGLLFGVAYRLLGQVADAEDVVQEAWLRWTRAPSDEVQNPRAYLVRVTTRLALDRLRRLKARREEYIGPWLPEPLLTGPDAAEEVELADSVSLALLVVLETLSPLERAVFVLHEAFRFSFAEVAEAVGRSEAAVRQLAHRARGHVEARRPRFEADPDTRQRVTEQFLAACGNGDMQALLAVLAPNVVLLSDSGGQARAPRQPVLGGDRVARFFLAIWPELPPETRAHLTQLNGSPGVFGTVGGQPLGALVFEIANGRIQTIYVVVNPDKLHGLVRRAAS